MIRAVLLQYAMIRASSLQSQDLIQESKITDSVIAVFWRSTSKLLGRLHLARSAVSVSHPEIYISGVDAK